MKRRPDRAVEKHPALVTHAVGPQRRIMKRTRVGTELIEKLACGHLHTVPGYPNGRGHGSYVKLNVESRRCAGCRRRTGTVDRTTYARRARLRRRGLL